MNKYLLSLLLLLPITFTFAQDESSEEEVEDVVVLGVKQSLIDAIDLKRSKVGVTEAITAEDIGKFPDQNLAESLGRIAGITIDRSNVEGSRVNVRGLGYMFNLVTLNGRSMPTVAGQYDHGRGFDFGDISSHGVSAVEVYKSANAVLPSGGIGATINMITTKPLVTGNAASFSVRTVNDTKVVEGDENTPEFDFLFSRTSDLKFGDYTLPLGFSLSGSHQERHNREVGTNEITWIPGGYGLSSSALVSGSAGRADGVVFTPESVGFKAKDNERLRENLQATFQIALTDNAVLTIDNTFSSLEFSTTGREKSQYWAGYDIDTYTLNDNGAVIAATIPNMTVGTAGGFPNDDGLAVDNTFLYGDSTKRNKSLGANLDIQVTDNFNLTIDHHESTSSNVSNGDNKLIYSNGGWSGCIGAGGQWGGNPWQTYNGSWQSCHAKAAARTLDMTGNVPVITQDWIRGGSNDSIDTLVGADMGPREGYISDATQDGEVNQTQIIGSWDNNTSSLEFISNIEFGLSTTTMQFDNMNARAKIVAGNTEGSPVMPSVLAMPDDAFTMTTTDTWNNGIFGSLQWADLSIEDAIYYFERANIAPYVFTDADDEESRNNRWYNNLNNWSEACTANDAVEDGVNTGWTAFGYDGWNVNYPTQTSMRGVICAGTPDSLNTIIEETDSVFVNVNFDTDYNGMPLKAQFGLRYEKITRSSNSMATVPVNTVWGFGAWSLAEYGTQEGLTFITEEGYYDSSSTNSYLLPTFNMSLGLNDNEVIRFGVSETIAQPSLWQTRAGFDLGDYTWSSPTSLARGNPELTPYTALNIDFAYENYYAEGSYYAVNVFTKEIEDYHGGDNALESFNNVPDVFHSRYIAATGQNPGSCVGANWGAAMVEPNLCWQDIFIGLGYAHPTADSTNGWPAGTYGIDGETGLNWVGIGDSDDGLLQFASSMPVNKYDGRLSGLELSVQHFFEGTPYGVQANAVMLQTDEEADSYLIGEQRALPGFGNGANFSVFYEDEKYSARLSYNWRDESYAGEDLFNPLFIEARGQLDFNASYIINDNAVVFIEGLNISDQDVRLFSRYKEMLFLYQDHGPIYKAGIRYKF